MGIYVSILFGVVFMEPRAGVFETTRWSVVDALRSEDPSRRARAAEALARQYLPSVYGFLLRRGLPEDLAEETAQGFFTDVVLTRRLFEQADPGVGRLRSLLIRSLENYRVDVHRKDRARPVLNGFDPVVLEGVRDRLRTRTPRGLTAEQVFEMEWAIGVLDEASRRCAACFVGTGQESHWRVFEAKWIRPGGSAGMTPDPSSADLASEHGYENGKSVRAAQQVVRRRFRLVLGEVLYEQGGTDLERELGALAEAIGRAG